ncbi:MAG: (Fe-S)-binding protein [Rubrivivax sp.]|nr:(Fe-S)-binding protein [Rubrivivax sp.]
MSPLGITLLMLVSFAGFGYLTWRKLSIVAHLQPEVRWDHPAARLKAVLFNGFMQQRMIARDWKPGLMHTVIFLGFMALLLRKVQLIVIGYHEPFVYPGLLGGLFAALKDVVEVAILGALVYAFYRRYVAPPKRLEPNREALLVLVLITIIIISDLLYDGFRFALFSSTDAGIAHERSFAFLGSLIGSMVAPWSPEVLQLGYHLSYWVQLVTVFTFLVLLPAGEHFHIVTALPTLFFRRGGPTNVVPSVDLEKMMSDDADAASVRVGARTARDLIWKDGLDAFTCTECGRCKDACPAFLTGKPLSLKWVNDKLKHHLLEQREVLLAPLAAGAEDPLPALVGPVISEDALWACTTCGYCEAACPIELEHLPKFFKLRQQRVMMEGEFPHELKPVFEAYESQSNPWGLPSQTRGDWASELGVPLWTSAAQSADFDVLFYVGSAESFDPRGQKIARAFVAILKAAGVRFAILGEAETSTGECVRRAGNEMLFQQLAATLVGTLDGLAVKRIVTCDPHAFNSLKNEYPEFAGHYEVQHHSVFIAELLRTGRLKMKPSFERVIFHDPCYLGRHNGEYEAPRQVIRLLAKDAPLEFALNGPKAMCCGAGGARMWQEESIGTRINVARAEQALAEHPQVIATACPYCAVMIEDGLKALGRESEASTKDIAELVAEALVKSPAQ